MKKKMAKPPMKVPPMMNGLGRRGMDEPNTAMANATLVAGAAPSHCVRVREAYWQIEAIGGSLMGSVRATRMTEVGRQVGA